MTQNNVNEKKSPNLFVRIIKRIFVHNIAIKITAVVTAALYWLILYGLA